MTLTRLTARERAVKSVHARADEIEREIRGCNNGIDAGLDVYHSICFTHRHWLKFASDIKYCARLAAARRGKK